MASYSLYMAAWPNIPGVPRNPLCSTSSKQLLAQTVPGLLDAGRQCASPNFSGNLSGALTRGRKGHINIRIFPSGLKANKGGISAIMV